jgi:hypothetical protein
MVFHDHEHHYFLWRVDNRPGLPGDIFSNQKSQFGHILEGLVMKMVGIFYGHLEYLTVIWYILWSFGNLMAIWDIFHRFGILCQEKSGNPTTDATKKVKEQFSFFILQPY